jgi:hypothetical protein
MTRGARRSERGRERGRLHVPRALAPLIGAAVLVASTRVIDLAWRRFRGMPADEDRSVSGRLLRATLLGSALALARRVGLPAAPSDGRD